MTGHALCQMTRVAQALLRRPTRLSHRLMMKVLKAAWGAGYAAAKAGL